MRKNKELIISQFFELTKKYNRLMLRWEDDLGIIEGEFKFKASYNGIEIEDTYCIRVEIPANYPNELPITKETGKTIPRNFHKFENDILCLEIETKMLIEFSENPTLLFYVEKFVVEYLYGFSFKKQYGYLPYGERTHGTPGFIEFYMELFKVSDLKKVIGILNIISSANYRGHHYCPCCNGKRIRNCHGKQILSLINLNFHKNFLHDLKLLTAYSRQYSRGL